MKITILFSLFIFTLSANSQKYKKIHKDAIVCDTHNDIISTCIERDYVFDTDLSGKTHSDLSRMLKGGLDVQAFSIFFDGEQKNPFQFANREIDTLYAWVKRNPSKMMLVSSPEELDKAIKEHKLASMIGVEGGHMIEDDLGKLDSLYNRGARYMTLTWNNNTSWATSAEYESGNQKPTGTTPQKKGLNEFGKQVVKRMNELGMMIDLSHTGEQTFWDAINLSTKPILVSHSDAYALSPVFRNLKDDQIKAVAKNGGVIDLNFYPAFLDSTVSAKEVAYFKKHRPEKKQLMDAGKKDFEADEIIAKKYPKEAEELVKRGYSKEDIDKILGGNFIRVFKANQEKL